MLTEAQVNEFRERGFLRGPKIYNDAEADALRQRLEEVMEGRSSAQPEAMRNMRNKSKEVVIQVVNIWEADDLFREHLYQPEICAMVAQLIGYPFLRVWHDQVQYKPPRIGGPTEWHQDHPYWPIIQPADLVSAWVALDDATVENGCMWMVPGSHHWGPHKGGTIGTEPETFAPLPDLSLLPKDADITPVPCEVQKGQVIFHHCLTWHGSPPNRSDRGRPAIAVHYMPGYTRYEPRGHHLVEHRVSVAPGEILQGEFFPTVWDHGPVAHEASTQP
ncbi:MAG: phytanoyl-CoA dioxygenase family protein [Armatimonadota bacterium]|nr:phytanoyl-CoA dioxygenase family protein [Armatimonadota bacterium]